MAERELTAEKREVFDDMIGHIPELNDPANYSTRNGNYPNVTYNGVHQNQWREGVEPSIRSKKIYVPINIWSSLSSHLAFPITSLQYNKLHVQIECRPICELFVVRDMDYFTTWVNDLSGPTQLPKNPENIFQYYNCPYIRPNLNDERYRMHYFLEGPPPWQKCIGDFSYNLTTHPTEQEALASITDTFYIKVDGTWAMNIELLTTYAFLEKEETRLITGKPQSYLIKRVFEQTTNTVAGTHRIDTNSIGMTSSWMWFFQRSDINLRNEWSNYTNWAYKHMPYPCILSLDLSFAEHNPAEPYITPCTLSCYAQHSICGMFLTGPTHPENLKEIMEEWSLYCDDQLRETSHPVGVFNFIEKYIRTPGNAKQGLYCYNFCLDTNRNVLQPSGGMNMSRFSNITFEFSTMLPFHRPIEPSDNQPIKCNDENVVQGMYNPTWKDYNYNYDIHIMEERYNVLVFSGGMATLMFPNN